MNKIEITKNQFSDLINLLNNVFYPLKNFVSEKEFTNIVNQKKIKKKFFPFPIFFGLTKKNYFKIRNIDCLDLYFKSKKLVTIKNIKFYNLNKKKISKKLYGVNYLKHPYYKKFSVENYIFMSFDFKKIYRKNLKHKYFISPINLKKILKKNNIRVLPGFHTRNVPHKAHQWIHTYLYEKYGSLLIQPLIGQYKKGEYSDKLIIKSNKLAAKIFNSKKVLSIPFFSYPRYAGYREAALHAIVRKNYGCTHFWVGRDHAGYKKFFGYYKSQRFCRNNQKKINIKIIAGKEPYYCNNCKIIKNTKCNHRTCSKQNIRKISGTKIRKLLKENKKIPDYLMDKNISTLISKKSLIN